MDLFLEEKSELKNVMKGLIKNFKNMHDIKVQHLHFDNAGENIDFEMVCKQKGMWMEFEYTTPGTPQKNGGVEQKFAIGYVQYSIVANFTPF